MKNFALAGAIAAAVFATPAMAQDTDSDLGGFTLAAVGGYDNISVETAGVTAREGGVVYGIAAGYDIDTGDTLIGLEAEVSDTSISNGIGNAGLDIYGGLRLGLQINEDDVVYLKAGYSNVDVDLADNLEGVRIGAGYEKTFSESFFGRLEYRYTNYNVSDVLNANVNGNRNQIVVTLGGRF